MTYRYRIEDRWNTDTFEIVEYGSGDRALGAVGPKFDSREQAARYAERNGIEIEAEEV